MSNIPVGARQAIFTHLQNEFAHGDVLAVAQVHPAVGVVLPVAHAQELALQSQLHLKSGEQHGLVGLDEFVKVVDFERLLLAGLVVS